MARKPATSTRGTISGRPANTTSWPRSDKTRAMPRLGGRFPPPDQFNHRIFAICRLLQRYPINHLANDRLGGAATELAVTTQQLPHIDIGEDGQHFRQFGAGVAGNPRELRGKRRADAVSVALAAPFEALLQGGPPMLVGKALEDQIPHAFIDVEDRRDRRRHIAWRRRLDWHAVLDHLLERRIDQLLLAAEDAEHRLHRGLGTPRHLLQREILDRPLAVELGGAGANARAGRRRLGGARRHHIGTRGAGLFIFHDNPINTNIYFVSIRLTRKYGAPRGAHLARDRSHASARNCGNAGRRVIVSVLSSPAILVLGGGPLWRRSWCSAPARSAPRSPGF